MFARANRPDTLTALTVNVDNAETRELCTRVGELDVDVPLTVIESPYREITRPVIDYIKRRRKGGPRDVINVYIPEYVVGRWWENLLHNQSSLRLKGRLLFEPGVMVTSVPWQLHSSAQRDLARVNMFQAKFEEASTVPPRASYVRRRVSSAARSCSRKFGARPTPRKPTICGCIWRSCGASSKTTRHARCTYSPRPAWATALSSEFLALAIAPTNWQPIVGILAGPRNAFGDMRF